MDIPLSDAEPDLVPVGPLPLTWKNQQQVLLQSLGLGSDISDDEDDKDDNDGSILSS